MPYAINDDLPPSVRDHLPFHAQEIFRAAFNNAYEAHFDDPDREEIAFRIAWAAVKPKYRKIGDQWVARSMMMGASRGTRSAGACPPAMPTAVMGSRLVDNP